MKTNRILAVALSAGLVLGGSSVVNAAPAPAATEDNYSLGYDTLAAAEDAAAKKALENDGVNNAYEIASNKVKNVKRYFYTLKYDETKEAPKKQNEVSDAKKLHDAKDAAIAELQNAGVTSDLFLNKIKSATSVETINTLKAELLKSRKESEAANKLKKAKEDALRNLKQAGITNEFLLKQINKAKTPEGVRALEQQLIESNAKSKPNPNDHDGYKTAEEARKAGLAALKAKGLEGSYTVEVREESNGGRFYYTFVEVKEAKGEPEVHTKPEYKPEDKKPEVKPAPSYDYSYPLIKPGKVDEDITLPELKESKEVEKEAKETTEVKEKSKAKENKKKEVKEVKKQAPARQAGRKNPKTGLESVAPVLSTLAISMAGIVATRKKNN